MGHLRGKRGRGAYGQASVFGIVQRNKQFDTNWYPAAENSPRRLIIRGHVALDSVIYLDGWLVSYGATINLCETEGM
ncbi:MAG: hypothetical protein OEM58_05470 [Nitrospirota bacterium]|nr:hypothetical protein [Nitrospirota bacterium]